MDLGHGKPDGPSFNRRRAVFGVSAAAALFRRKALEEVGPPFFDESLFAYYEDVDLAWRLGRAGWRHVYEPRAVGYHGRRGPAEKPITLRARAFANRYLVWAKNESHARFALYAPIALPWEGIRLLTRAWRDPAELAYVPHALIQAATRVVNRALKTGYAGVASVKSDRTAG